MTASDWLLFFVNALVGGFILVVVVVVKRIVTQVRRHHPLANRRFLRQYRAEQAGPSATGETTVVKHWLGGSRA